MKRVGLIKILETNSVFLVVLLLFGRQNKEKIFEAFQNSSLKRQRVKTGPYERLTEDLLKWFTSMHGNNGRILLEKAREFSKAFNYNDFTASNRQLRGQKER